MSDNIDEKIKTGNTEVLLIGVGNMGMEYAKVLKGLQVPFAAVGRSQNGVNRFEAETGHTAFVGGIEDYLTKHKNKHSTAIIAVSVEEARKTAIICMDYGINNVLLEKPGGLYYSDIEDINNKRLETKSNIYIAYNRRFYSSVQKAENIISKDGGVISFNFEFTEWSDNIRDLNVSAKIKEQWLYVNSTHVIDLAFYLGGRPVDWTHYAKGETDWHKKGAIYAGAGISDKGALFSYQANWNAPGRWSVEVFTQKHRLYFKPMEELHIQELMSVQTDKVEIDDVLDREYKPGLYEQVKAFLFDNNSKKLKSIEDQIDDWKIYETIETK